ncbi:AAA family ATPase [Embleya sp. NPDC056575]|uniref:nSTAND1 domain-containing NTPase n=1 Tax=unclassified Embleya TaxID=2699296 RepID=UPI00368A967A
MIPDEPRASEPAIGRGPGEVHLEAHASDAARVYLAAGDQHFYFVDDVRYVRRTTPGAVAGECPYPGLSSFGPEQARWFFGRDRLLAELTERLDDRRDRGGMQMVIAPSGAGKSSLLRAGLVPALARTALPGSHRWPMLVFTPGADPLHTLACQLASLTGADPAVLARDLAEDPPSCLSAVSRLLREHLDAQEARHARVVLVVDQFEELFTQCHDRARRHTFVDVLARVAAGGDQAPLGLVVVGARADFYTACVDHPPLRTALQDAPLVVGPMSDAELREAILHPARSVGVHVEDGLVGLLLRDLGTTAREGTPGSTGYEAGRLPLLAHALRATWRRCGAGGTLTVEGYELTGGIHGAIARTADDVYERLDDTGRQVAESLFLRLVRIGDGTEDTRRRLSRAELANTAADPAVVARVVDAFTDKRLLTRHRDTVEITHEALLHSWPELRGWIDTDRVGRLTHQTLEDAAAIWDRESRDSSLLYTGNRLEVVDAWAARHPADPSPTAVAFLRAAKRREQRSRRVRRRVLAGITALAVLASGIAVFAFRQRDRAQAAATTAITNQISAEALQLSATDPALAAQLALLAYRREPNRDRASQLMNLQNSPTATALTAAGEAVSSIAFAPREHVLATGNRDGTVRLWNAGDPHRPKALGQPANALAGQVDSLAFSPDGHTLAAVTTDGTVALWSVSDPRAPAPLGEPLPGTGDASAGGVVAFSPDGHTLAAGGGMRTNSGGSGFVNLWNVTDPTRPIALNEPLIRPMGAVKSVLFSPDGKVLITGSWYLDLWVLGSPSGRGTTGEPSARFSTAGNVLASSPDSSVVVAGGPNDSIEFLDPANPHDPLTPRISQPLAGRASPILSLAFGPDGRTLAIGHGNGVISLWNTTDAVQPAALGQLPTASAAPVESVAFGPDGHTLAAVQGHGTVALWSLSPTLLAGGGPVAFSPDGHTLATLNSITSPRLWNVADPHNPSRLGMPQSGSSAPVGSVAFSPDGHILAIGSIGDNGTIWLSDITDPRKPVPLGPPPTGFAAPVNSAAFAPNGRTIAAGSGDGTVRLWNVSDPRTPTALGKPLTGPNGPVNSVAFSPNGHTLATAGVDNTVRLWELDVDAAIQRICATSSGALTRERWKQYVPQLAYRPPCQA